jgi:DNA-directed RNA polymerase specialized sigma24 family protein
MREMTGIAIDEIATALGINEGTVKSRLSRARQSAGGRPERLRNIFRTAAVKKPARRWIRMAECRQMTD